jgi:hypothetical protein
MNTKWYLLLAFAVSVMQNTAGMTGLTQNEEKAWATFIDEANQIWETRDATFKVLGVADIGGAAYKKIKAEKETLINTQTQNLNEEKKKLAIIQINAHLAKQEKWFRLLVKMAEKVKLDDVILEHALAYNWNKLPKLKSDEIAAATWATLLLTVMADQGVLFATRQAQAQAFTDILNFTPDGDTNSFHKFSSDNMIVTVLATSCLVNTELEEIPIKIPKALGDATFGYITALEKMVMEPGSLDASVISGVLNGDPEYMDDASKEMKKLFKENPRTLEMLKKLVPLIKQWGEKGYFSAQALAALQKTYNSLPSETAGQTKKSLANFIKILEKRAAYDLQQALRQLSGSLQKLTEKK